jgi:hypothetical protein
MSAVTAEQDILRIINLDVALSPVQGAEAQQALERWLGLAVTWQQASLADLAEMAQTRSEQSQSGQIAPLVLIYPSLATALNRGIGAALAEDDAVASWQALVEAILRFYRKRRASVFLLASDAVFDNPEALRLRLVRWAGCGTAEAALDVAEPSVPESAIGRVMAGYLHLGCHRLRKLSEELAAGGMALLPDSESAEQTTRQAVQALQHSAQAASISDLQAALVQQQHDHLAALRAATETAAAVKAETEVAHIAQLAAVEAVLAASQTENTALKQKSASLQAQLVAMQGVIEQEFIARQQQTAIAAVDTSQKSELERKIAQQEALLQLERSKAEAALFEQRRMLAELLKQGEQEASRIADMQTALRHQTALLQDRDNRISELIAQIRQQAEAIAATETAVQTAQVEIRTEAGLRRQKEAEVAALIGSTSWKVTKPLRVLRGAGKIQR